MTEPLRIGVLGPGRIVSRVMKDFDRARGVCLTAVASRSIERAQEAAGRYGAKYAFGSYEEMAACDEVDMVYVATPHPFHCEQAIQMMEHGKHVLCEKPISISGEQTERMIRCAREKNVFLMEAMWSRFFPATRRYMQLVRSGAIGKISHVYGVFSSSCPVDEESRLFRPALAGGALLDIGVYPLMAATMLLGYQPEEVQGLCTLASTGVDGRMAVQMRYPDGATAQMMTSLDAAAPSHLFIYGTEGYMEVEDFWHPTRFSVSRASGERIAYSFPLENEGFHYEFEHAAECIQKGLNESPVMTWEESLAVSRMTERLRHDAGVFYPGEERQ